VFARRYASTATPLGTEFQVNVQTTLFQAGQAVVFDPSGSFVVVWQSEFQDGFYSGVFGRTFTSDGVPGPEFQINTYTESTQVGPQAASDANGNFVVVWSSYGQDDPYGFASYGIFGQRMRFLP
jgi:hypothetical protein